MRSGLLLAFVLGSLAADVALAQPPSGVSASPLPVRFERLTPREGLSQGTIHAVLQDRQGFWWLATEDGLNRYDGHGVTVFRQQPFDSTSLASSMVRGLYEDARGVLWAATAMGLDRMDPGTGRFRHIPMANEGTGDARHLGAGYVFDVTGDREGGVWVTTMNGLSRFEPRTARFEHFSHTRGTLPSDTAYTVYQDPSGQVWAGTRQGLARFDARTRAFRPFRSIPPSDGWRWAESSPTPGPRTYSGLWGPAACSASTRARRLPPSFRSAPIRREMARSTSRSTPTPPPSSG